MLKPPAKSTVKVWTRLIRAQHAALSHVEAELKRAEYPPLIWYDLLLELRREKKSGLRPYELEQRMLLPQYGLSRLIARIARAGYLAKTQIEEDGRGYRVMITDAGMQLLERMWPAYGAAIEQAVGKRLTKEEAKSLSVLLEKLA